MYNKNKGFFNKSRKSRIKPPCYRVLTLTTCVILFASSPVTSFAFDGGMLRSSFTNQIDDAKDQKQDLEKKKQELKNRLNKLEGEKGNILQYIEKLDKELLSLEDDVQKLNSEIAEVSATLDATKKKLKKAKKTEKNQYDTMKKRIQYMYENGETNYLEVLMSSDSIGDMLNQAEYVAQISDYDQSLLDRYTQTKQDISDMTVRLKKDLEQKNLLNEELVANQSALETLINDKQKELKKYEKNISETETMSEGYEQQIAEQEDLIEDLLDKERKRIEEEERKRRAEEERKRKEEEERKRREEEKKRKQEEANNNSSSNNNSSNNNSSNNNSSSGSDNSSNNSTSTKGFTWPLPSSRRITSYFGNRGQPTAGASTYHKGVDISAPTGSNILAAKGGTVVTSSYNVAAGNYIMISHGNGVYTVYMHCSKLLVSVGETVNAGQVIALVGSTGVSTGPHLHFGVSINGSYVNPLDYVG